MGHTLSSQRQVLDSIIGELHSFSRALRQSDRQIYERLLRNPLSYYGSISYASSMHTWAFILITMLIEQERKVQQVRYELDLIEQRLKL